MTDLDNDPVAAAFGDFRTEVAHRVRPAGAARTRANVRSRKRRQTVVLGALATLVVAIPVVAGVTVVGRPHDHPATATVRSGSGFFVFPNPLKTYHAPQTAPRGGISVADLYDAKLSLPKWAPTGLAQKCPTGPVQFTAGHILTEVAGNLIIDNVNYADVDHDGKYETIARVLCDGNGNGGNHAVSQVVAFKRVGNKGIRTLGQVFAPTGAVTDICGVRADSPTTIQVQVVGFPLLNGCLGTDDLKPRYVINQWRTYAWNGSKFVPSGGPIKFPANPYASDLAVTNGDLNLVRQSNGHYLGTLTVTVTNLGSATMSYRTDTLLTTGMQLVTASGGCTPTTKDAGGGTKDLYCTGAGLGGGASRTTTFTIDAPRRITIDYVPATDVLPSGNLGDPNGQNDRAALHIEFQG